MFKAKHLVSNILSCWLALLVIAILVALSLGRYNAKVQREHSENVRVTLKSSWLKWQAQMVDLNILPVGILSEEVRRYLTKDQVGRFLVFSTTKGDDPLIIYQADGRRPRHVVLFRDGQVTYWVDATLTQFCDTGKVPDYVLKTWEMNQQANQ